MLQPQLRKGAGDLLVLAVLESQPRHGYEIGKLIDANSDGLLRFHVASLYPLLYRMEKRGWIRGQWVEKPNARRRRFYRLTPAGRRALEDQRSSWQQFARAMDLSVGVSHA